MQLSITGDGYIKCVADSGEHILDNQITIINASNLSLPCMKDRYDDNVLFYHMGDNISIFEYIAKKIIGFDELKELAGNMANLFIKLEAAGLPNSKIVADIRHIYISPSTKQLRVLQCPIEEYDVLNNYQRIMSDICNSVKSQNAYVVIGYILEEVGKSNFDIRDFARSLDRLENVKNGKSEKLEMKTPVETRVVEKRIVENKTNYMLCGGVAVFFEMLGVIGLPLLFEVTGLSKGMEANIISCICTILLTIIVFVVIKSNTKDESYTTTNVATDYVNDAKVERNQDKYEVHRKELFGTVTPTPVQPISSSYDDFDDTGLLEEEVEINPLKRQEQYNKKAEILAYLIDEETNKKHQITKSVFVVGRSAECDLVVDSTIVSKRHAEIVCEDDIYYVKDLQSSNYTYLNKATIEPMELYRIEDNARIGFGNKWFIFKTSL